MLVAAPCIFYITYLGWPPSGILIVTGLLWYCARKETNAGERAIVSLLGPVNIGLGLVTAIQTYFNFVHPKGMWRKLLTTQHSMLWMDNHFSKWFNLSPWAAILVLVTLTVLTIRFPDHKIVERYMRAKKYVSRGLAALGVATSFTFFAGACIVGPGSEQTYKTVRSQFLQAKKDEMKAVVQRAAVESLTETMRKAPPAVRSYYRAIFESLADVDAHGESGKAVLEDYLTDRFNIVPGSPEGLGKVGTVKGFIDFPCPGKSDLVAELPTEMQKKQEEENIESDAEKGLSETMGAVLGLGTDKAKDLIETFADLVIKHQGGEFGKWMVSLLGEVADNKMDAVIAPLKDKMVKRYSSLIVNGIGAGENASKDLSGTEAKLAYAEMDELRSAKEDLGRIQSDYEDQNLNGHLKEAVKDAYEATAVALSLQHIAGQIATRVTVSKLLIKPYEGGDLSAGGIAPDVRAEVNAALDFANDEIDSMNEVLKDHPIEAGYAEHPETDPQWIEEHSKDNPDTHPVEHPIEVP